MIKKRIFDIGIVFSTAILWLPVIIICAVLLFLLEGWPVFYVSRRRTYHKMFKPLIKFRVMIKNADKKVNRDTIPVGNQRFLNIPPDSPLYTRIGRWFERFFLTELPQLFQVITGDLSLVGNRPLPANVIRELKKDYPYAENRFETHCGMTGPTQLVGRDFISDEDRLSLEIEYCRFVKNSYSMRLDLLILYNTVLIGLGIRDTFSINDVTRLMSRSATSREVMILDDEITVSN